MEQDKRRTYTIVAIVAVVVLLFGCLVAAVVGGAVGFLFSRRQSEVSVERALQQGFGEAVPVPVPTLPGFPPATPVPPSVVVPGMMQGAVVVQVLPGTPADQAGLKPGDVIIAVDRSPVSAWNPLPEVIAQYAPGDLVTIYYLRQNQQYTTQVKLGESPTTPGQAYLGVRFRERGMSGMGEPSD